LSVATDARASGNVAISFVSRRPDRAAGGRGDDAARTILCRWTHLSPEHIAHAPLPDFGQPVSAESLRFWLDLSRSQGLIDQDYDANSFIWKQ